ncbi:hypothetical protein GQ600_12787 [Phytophthora cactorum]|nr:hypothetical protein GQ600_12787 [Phytophthora cactorum]
MFHLNCITSFERQVQHHDTKFLPRGTEITYRFSLPSQIFAYESARVPPLPEQDYQKRCTTVASLFIANTVPTNSGPKKSVAGTVCLECNICRVESRPCFGGLQRTASSNFVAEGMLNIRFISTLPFTRFTPARLQFYSSGKGDPTCRRRFFANRYHNGARAEPQFIALNFLIICRVGKTTDRLVTAMSKRDDSIDALLAEFDKSLSMSRRVFQGHVPETDTGEEFCCRYGLDCHITNLCKPRRSSDRDSIPRSRRLARHLHKGP